MIDRTHESKKTKHTKVVRVQVHGQSVQKELTDTELSVIEEALALANPTPEEDEAFREYLKKNGSGTGDP